MFLKLQITEERMFMYSQLLVFFFPFGHECVYLCVRPQFKVIFDHKLNGCTENGILLSMGVWLINNVALD